MSDPALLELLTLCMAAAGLMLLGGARAALPRSSAGVRWTAAAACALAPAAVSATLGLPLTAAVSAGVVAAAAVTFSLIGSNAVLVRLVVVLRRMGRPGVQAAVLTAGGAGLLVGSLARYDSQVEAELDADMAFMTNVTWRPPLGPAAGVTASTDAGRPVELLQPEAARPPAEAQSAERHTLSNMDFSDRLIRIEPASDVSNCHGWVFTGGRYWIGPDAVENILADNGYHQVSDPRPGDVAVYREGAQINHTGIVRTGGPGSPVLIESKWGWMGVFLHRPEDTCYGRHYTFYRGPRSTHVLAGLAPSPPGALQVTHGEPAHSPMTSGAGH